MTKMEFPIPTKTASTSSNKQQRYYDSYDHLLSIFISIKTFQADSITTTTITTATSSPNRRKWLILHQSSYLLTFQNKSFAESKNGLATMDVAPLKPGAYVAVIKAGKNDLLQQFIKL